VCCVLPQKLSEVPVAQAHWGELGGFVSVSTGSCVCVCVRDFSVHSLFGLWMCGRERLEAR